MPDTMKTPRYTLQAGRAILLWGQPFIYIGRPSDSRYSPVLADDAATTFVKFLNAEVDRLHLKY